MLMITELLTQTPGPLWRLVKQAGINHVVTLLDGGEQLWRWPEPGQQDGPPPFVAPPRGERAWDRPASRARQHQHRPAVGGARVLPTRRGAGGRGGRGAHLACTRTIRRCRCAAGRGHGHARGLRPGAGHRAEPIQRHHPLPGQLHPDDRRPARGHPPLRSAGQDLLRPLPRRGRDASGSSRSSTTGADGHARVHAGLPRDRFRRPCARTTSRRWPGTATKARVRHSAACSRSGTSRGCAKPPTAAPRRGQVHGTSGRRGRSLES